MRFKSQNEKMFCQRALQVRQVSHCHWFRRMIIPSKRYYVFFRLAKTRVMDKCLFKGLPAVMRSCNVAYLEVFICHGFDI